MLDLLMWLVWFLMGGYSFWFLTRAKKSQAMTLDELVMLWKIHKQQAGCGAPLSRVEPVVDSRSKEFLGFRCKCGFQYVSKRPIVQRPALESEMFAAILVEKGNSSPC